MMVLIIFGAIIVALFAASFFSKRRFGLLGLALTAGATLSSIWEYDAGLVISSLGILPEGPTTQAVTLTLVTLLPAILLFFHGYKYKSAIGRVIGSALFTALALAFLVEPIGYVLPLEGLGADVYNWLVANRELVISGGVILAVFDLFLTKRAKPVEKESKKK